MSQIKRKKRRKSRSSALPVIIGALVLMILFALVALIVIPESKNDPQIPASEPDRSLRNFLGKDGEMRGVWIATVSNINFPSAQGLSKDTLQSELDSILALCKEEGLNTVLFQARPCSDALYDSHLFPTSKYLSGTQGEAADGNFDPLGYLTEKAHAMNIAVFAWINPLRVTTNSKAVLSPDNPASLHPEWCIEYGGKTWYDPGIPEVRKLVADGVYEVVTGYDVDGVIFDDYFYPYPEDGLTFDDDNSYEKYGGDKKLGDWRRENVNDMIRQCHEAVRKADTGAWFGVSPFGIWQNDSGFNGGSDTHGLNAYTDIYCDALEWIESGTVDFISPQIYWNFESAPAPYATLVDWWKNAVDGTPVQLYISHAAYRVSEWDKDEMTKQIEYAREKGCHGSIFYGYKAITDNENGVMDAIAKVYG